jgi:hypothetical protein
MAAAMMGASGCALLNAAASGDPSRIAHAGAETAAQAARIANDAEKAADAKCRGMDTKVIPLDEERAIGGAIAVGLTDHYRAHFFIDGNTEKKNVEKLAADAKAGKVSLPASARNDLNAYLSVVGRNLTSFSPRPEIVWTFGVLDSPTVNAFSAPGGYVYVTTGLLKLVDNEAQLAGVLGHEIGHISGRHAMKGYSKVKFDQCNFATKGGVYLSAGIDSAPAQLREAAQFAKFFSGGKFDLDSPDMAAGLIARLTDGFIEEHVTKGLATPDELEADKYAIELAAFAGYDTGEYEKFLQKLGAPSKDDHHPPLADRLAAIKSVRDGIAPFTTKGVKPDNSAALKVVKK